MASTGPVFPVVGNGGQQLSRISSLNELVYFKAELRDLGLAYQVMECKAPLDRIGRIWSNVAYNGPVFVIVSRYDRLGPHLSLYYLLWAVWHFLSGFIILRSNCLVARKWPEMDNNHTKCPDLARCDELWPHLTQHSQLWSVFNKCDWKGYVWVIRPPSGRYCIIWHLLVPHFLL